MIDRDRIEAQRRVPIERRHVMSEPMTKERLAEIVSIAGRCDDTMRRVVDDLIAEMIRVAEQRDEALALLRPVQEAVRTHLEYWERVAGMRPVPRPDGSTHSNLLHAALATVKRP